MKKVWSLATIFVCTVTLLGCGGNETDPGGETGKLAEKNTTEAKGQVEFTFSWWGGDPRHEATLELIALYESLPENEHVKIHPHYGAWTNWQEQFTTAFSGNQEADLMQVNYNWIPIFSPNGEGFYNLRKLDHIINLDNYDEDLLDSLSSGEENILQALPTNVSSQGPLLNVTLYEKAGVEIPRTWDELMEAGRTIQAELGEDHFALGKVELHTHLFQNYLIQTTGRHLISEDGKLNNTVEELEAGFQLFVDMIENGVIPNHAYDSEAPDELNQNWIKGRYGGYMNWDSTISRFTETLEEGNEVMAATHFTMDRALRSGILRKPMGIAISRHTEYPEEVARFLEWMLTDPQAIEIMQLERGIPANAKAYEHLVNQGMLQGVAVDAYEIHANADDTVFMHPFFEHQLVRDVYEFALENVLFEKWSPLEAAEYVVNNLPDELTRAMNDIN